MPKALFLYHDTHFDLVDEEELGDAESLGEYHVENARSGETEVRHKIAVDQENNFTEVLIPDDYATSPVALTHLVETLTDRHAAEEHVHSVWCEDARLGAKIAALLDAELLEEPLV